MAKKVMCKPCKVEKEHGYASTNNSMIFWQKGKQGPFKSLLTKAEPIMSYSCPKCGRIEMIRVVKENEK